jgi:hypothetical protein
MNHVDVYIVVELKYPWRPIKVMRCEIVVRKWSWAIDGRNKRHLVGASAFFTEASASSAQVDALQKLETKWTYIKRPYIFQKATTLLDRLHPGRHQIQFY